MSYAINEVINYYLFTPLHWVGGVHCIQLPSSLLVNFQLPFY